MGFETNLSGMFSGQHDFYIELILFAVFAPVFGIACALVAKDLRRRQWVWFLIGFFFNFAAVLALVVLEEWDRKPPANRKIRK